MKKRPHKITKAANADKSQVPGTQPGAHSQGAEKKPAQTGKMQQPENIVPSNSGQPATPASNAGKKPILKAFDLMEKIGKIGKIFKKKTAQPAQLGDAVQRSNEASLAASGKPLVDNKSEHQSQAAIGNRRLSDIHLSNEFKNIRKEKTKKKKKENLFSVRGLIRAINLQSTLEKAGLEDTDPKKVSSDLMRINIIILSIITLYFGLKAFFSGGGNFAGFLVFAVSLWVGLFFLLLGLLWAFYLFYLDMKIYKRTQEVEKVFPDFLELASSNISAGMPIDRALWYAVRPNFGILAKEIESVAKNTLAGQDLSDALQDFAKKYDSKVIKRSISLLLEGLAAGGELAGLLSKIALDIEESRILKRDMAASVMTYVIFITFASIVAAPALLGLSTQLLAIITKITSTMATEGGGMASNTMISMKFSSDPATVGNFQTFAYVMLTISSISAACIVSIIQKGRVKDGLSKIPVFVLVSVLIYFASNYMMAMMFSGLI